MADLIKGIDISTIQGTVDFVACAAAGIQFVICRCGVGNGGKDANYDKNVTAAIAAGLKVAAYHFIYPLPTTASQPLRDPVKQAQLHAGWAGSTSTVPVVCCDLEWPAPTDWAKWGCSAAQIVDWTQTYLQAYQAATGITPVVYTYPYFAKAIQLPASFAQQYQLWIASYEPTPAIPAPWNNWVLWQDSGGTQKLPSGIPVDTDKAVDLSLWNVQAPVPVAPAPPPDPAPPVITDPDPVEPAPEPAVPVPAPSNNVLQTVIGFLTGFFKR
jgi:lysozyme